MLSKIVRKKRISEIGCGVFKDVISANKKGITLKDLFIMESYFVSHFIFCFTDLDFDVNLGTIGVVLKKRIIFVLFSSCLGKNICSIVRKII